MIKNNINFGKNLTALVDDKTCPICQENQSDQKLFLILPCHKTHQLCAPCIIKIINDNRLCPFDRTTINLNALSPKQKETYTSAFSKQPLADLKIAAINQANNSIIFQNAYNSALNDYKNSLGKISTFNDINIALSRLDYEKTTTESRSILIKKCLFKNSKIEFQVSLQKLLNHENGNLVDDLKNLIFNDEFTIERLLYIYELTDKLNVTHLKEVTIEKIKNYILQQLSQINSYSINTQTFLIKKTLSETILTIAQLNSLRLNQFIINNIEFDNRWELQDLFKLTNHFGEHTPQMLINAINTLLVQQPFSSNLLFYINQPQNRNSIINSSIIYLKNSQRTSDEISNFLKILCSTNENKFDDSLFHLVNLANSQPILSFEHTLQCTKIILPKLSEAHNKLYIDVVAKKFEDIKITRFDFDSYQMLVTFKKIAEYYECTVNNLYKAVRENHTKSIDMLSLSIDFKTFEEKISQFFTQLDIQSPSSKVVSQACIVTLLLHKKDSNKVSEMLQFYKASR
ncbi:MAG: RING finger protein [Pseudomonadota bacterium]